MTIYKKETLEFAYYNYVELTDFEDEVYASFEFKYTNKTTIKEIISSMNKSLEGK